MKNKKKRQYLELEKKLFRETFKLLLFITLIVFLLFLLTDNSFGNFIVRILQSRIGLDEGAALTFYHSTFRSYKYYLYALLLFLLFFLSVRRIITMTSKYFTEIEIALDNLKEGESIYLSEELKPLENKLNAIQLETKEQKQELLMAEQQKNDLIVYLAHDIKTPLTSVLGYLQLLSETLDLPKEQREKYIKIALDKGKRLETLIDEFFEITRYNLKEMPLIKRDLNFSFLLDQVIEEFYPLLQEKNKEIIKDYPTELYFYGDSNQLGRAMGNLLKNAITYSYPNTNIDLKAFIDKNSIKIEISNQTKTLSQMEIDTIFTPFNRLDEGRQTSTGGAGLGLSVAKKIINNHKGSIEVVSENETITFIITLPIIKNSLLNKN